MKEFSKFKSILSKHVFTRLLGKLFANTIKKLFKSLNPDQYNGASLIGLRGIVVKSHGNASSLAFLTAICEAAKEIERQVPNKISSKLEQSLANSI